MIRDVFAQTNEAKIRGYQKDALALMLKVGVVKLVKVMALLKLKCTLPDVYVPCEVCDGKRYNRETLEVTYKGKNIAEVLEMTVEEATYFLKTFLNTS